MDFIKQHVYVILGVTCIGLMGAFYMGRQGLPQLALAPSVDTVTLYGLETGRPFADEAAARDIKVHIVGEVASPGVYALSPDDRVEDAVAAAGGVTQAADLARVNLAARIADGMKITIPAADDPGAVATATASDLVNINGAGLEELQTLPGIGPAIAANIIAHRDENGPFAAVEDIRNVSRIGEATYDKIKDKITAK